MLRWLFTFFILCFITIHHKTFLVLLNVFFVFFFNNKAFLTLILERHQALKFAFVQESSGGQMASQTFPLRRLKPKSPSKWTRFSRLCCCSERMPTFRFRAGSCDHWDRTLPCSPLTGLSSTSALLFRYVIRKPYCPRGEICFWFHQIRQTQTKNTNTSKFISITYTITHNILYQSRKNWYTEWLINM